MRVNDERFLLSLMSFSNNNLNPLSISSKLTERRWFYLVRCSLVPEIMHLEVFFSPPVKQDCSCDVTSKMHKRRCKGFNITNNLISLVYC